MYVRWYHRTPPPIGDRGPGMSSPSPSSSALAFRCSKSDQKRRVSSPAPVQTDSPSGAVVMKRTRVVCPVSVAMRDILG